MGRLITVAFIAALLVFLGQSESEAARLTSVRVQETATVPQIRPDWPVPNEPNQLFYLQRSSNLNTVVYTALFDSAGVLNKKRPSQVYWRRYNTDGARKALKPIESRFAYGVNSKPAKTPGEYIVTLKPLPELPMLLRQSGPGKAELWVTLGGRTVKAVYAFVSIDESGLIPKVTQVALHGIDPNTGRAISETFAVKGGAITH